jgi:diaminopimelate decarboxylase
LPEVPGFSRQQSATGSADDLLTCDGVSLAAIAAVEGTPIYIYSAALLRERYRALDAAFGDYPHAIHYALKANSTLALARLLCGLGACADANSVWEIDVAKARRLYGRRHRLHRRWQNQRGTGMRDCPGPESDQRRIGRRTGSR